MILKDYILSLGIPEQIFTAWLRLPQDKQLLGDLLQYTDKDHETVQGKETYAWYRAFSEWVKPRAVAEIGVRFGYTLKALRYDASIKVFGFDNESYIDGSLQAAKQHLAGAQFFKCNTQEMAELSIPPVDIFHVDGDHSSAGAYHDLQLAWDVVKKGGWVLIDDVQGLYYQTQQDFNVRQAATQFCNERKLKPLFIPTYRGMFAIQK